MLNDIGNKDEYLLKYGIRGISTISEKSFSKMRIIFNFIDDTELYYDIERDEDLINNKIAEVIHNIIIKRRVENILKIKERIYGKGQ